MSEEKRSLEDTRLSYSSYTTLKNCEQRYYHYKIAGTPVDSDYDDDATSLVLGKAFHSLLEGLEHNPLADNDTWNKLIPMVQGAANIGNDDMALVIAMAKKYLQLKATKMSHLKPVGIEVEISSDIFVGYVDVVLADESNGEWYIGDMKTAARHNEAKESSLARDAQLNLYSSFKEQIAEKLGLDVTKFKGALYIVTNKTTAKRKATEKLSEYVSRLMGSIVSKAYVVPYNEELVAETVYDFKQKHNTARLLRLGAEPVANYSYCENYFKPCPYWSQCHKRNYTERTMQVWTAE